MKIRIGLVVIVLGLLLGKSTQESVECGIRKVNHPEKDNKNYAGDVYPGQWPWSAAIYARKDNRTVEYICGGALISRKFVLTSKLCVTGEAGALLAADKVLIRLGTHKHNVVNVGKAKHRYVARIHQPIEYDVTSWNEVVLLEMRVEVRFTDYVQPVCISQSKVHFFDQFLITGWGAQNSHKDLGTIREILNSCMNSQNKFKHHKELCEKDRGSILYEFDRFENIWYIHSIIDCESASCEGLRFAGFMDVADYLTFIIKITNLDYLRKVRKGQRFDPSQNYPNLLPKRNCGHPRTKHIEKESNTRLYEFPWLARIMYYYKVDKRIYVGCLGTLISYRYVLTGAICFDNDTPKFVRLGDYNVDSDPDCDLEDESECALPVRDYDVEYITVHPDYQEVFAPYDIALVRTKKDVRYEDHINPVCLPVTQELRQLELPEYVVTSWGWKPHLIQDSSIPQKPSLSTVNSSKCFNIWKSLDNHPKMFICTKAPNFDTHRSAPLGQYVSNDRERFVQFVQFGFILRQSHFGGFSLHLNISHFMDWIIANMHD